MGRGAIRTRVATDGDDGQGDPGWEAEEEQEAEDEGADGAEEAQEPEADEGQSKTSPPQGKPEPARRARVSRGQTVGVDALEEFDEDAFIPMPRYEPYRPVKLVRVEPAEGEPVRAGPQDWADPRPERVLSPGQHCVARMFPVALQTGVAQSMARASLLR